MKNFFAGKTVLITGVGKNIGREIAEEFFSQETNVIVNDILPVNETEISKKMLLSERFLFSQGDITSIAYREKLIKEALEKFSSIDILINNVGIGSEKGFFDMEPEIMKKSIETNLVAPFFLSQKIAKQMVEKKLKVQSFSFPQFMRKYHPEIRIILQPNRR